MAIDDLEKRLTAIEEQLKPRPRSVNAIVAITVTVVLAGAAAIWGLANVIRDRPTATQIQEILRSSDGSHDRSIQNEQAAQRILIRDVGRQLDTLLGRSNRPR